MSTETDKLEFAQEILTIRRKTCDNCWHSRDGHCALLSCDCATSVLNREANPPLWTPYRESKDIKEDKDG